MGAWIFTDLVWIHEFFSILLLFFVYIFWATQYFSIMFSRLVAYMLESLFSKGQCSMLLSFGDKQKITQKMSENLWI